MKIKMNEQIKKLIKLSTENPDMEIIPMTHYKVCCSDEYFYWRGEIECVSIHSYVNKKDEESIEGTMILGKDNILGYIFEDREKRFNIIGNTWEETKDQVEDMFEKLRKENQIKEAIFIYINV